MYVYFEIEYFDILCIWLIALGFSGRSALPLAKNIFGFLMLFVLIPSDVQTRNASATTRMRKWHFKWLIFH